MRRLFGLPGNYNNPSGACSTFFTSPSCPQIRKRVMIKGCEMRDKIRWEKLDGLKEGGAICSYLQALYSSRSKSIDNPGKPEDLQKNIPPPAREVCLVQFHKWRTWRGEAERSTGGSMRELVSLTAPKGGQLTKKAQSAFWNRRQWYGRHIGKIHLAS